MPVQFNIPEAEFRSRAKRIKALAFDLDDTLLDSEKNIPGRALTAIHTLQKKGLFVTICTARNCSAAQYYAQQLGIQGVYSAVSGCQLVDGQTGELLRGRSICDRDAVRLIAFCLEQDAPFSLSVGQEGYVGGPLEPDGAYMKLRSSRKKMVDPVRSMKKLADPEILYGQTVYKVVVHSEDFHDTLSRFLREHLPGVQCTVTSKGVVNLFPAGSDKGVGVLQIAEWMGIQPAGFCAFGDFSNDVPMFQACGLSVAMGNAEDAVRRKAAAVTEPADRNGIAEFLESVFLTQ